MGRLGQPTSPGLVCLSGLSPPLLKPRYHGSKKAAEARLPFDAGFESVSVVAAVGPGVRGFSVGDSVATLTYDGFAEWAVTPAKVALKVPRASMDIVPLLTSGLTASIGADRCGQHWQS